MNTVAFNTAHFVWRRRFFLAALCLACSIVAASQFASLSVSNSIEIWYPEDDPELVNYREFTHTYGNDEIVVAAISRNDGFDNDDGTAIVAGLTDALLAIDGVANVTSLVTVPHSLAQARGRLLSDDGMTTALVIQLMGGEAFELQRSRLLQDIRQSISGLGLQPRLAGYGVIFEGLNQASTRGTTSLLIYAHGLMVLLLGIFFRRPGPVLVTLVAVGNASIWTMGLYAALGQKLNMITMVLPTLVLVISIADCVHILRSVARQDRSLGRDARVVKGLAEVIGPCLLTTVTTAAGFLALTVSDLPVVTHLGWFGAAGMIAAFLASVILCTAGLSWSAAEPAGDVRSLDAVVRSLYGCATRFPRTVITLFAGASAVAILGICQLVTDTNSIGYLATTHPVRRDSDFIESKMGPYVPVEFTVRAQGDIMSPDNLDAIQHWQLAVSNMGKIGWSWSLLDALAVDRQSRPSTLPRFFLEKKLDRARRFSPATIAAMLAGNSEMRISFGAPVMSAANVRSLIAEIVERANLPANLELRPAGYSPLYTRIVDALVWSQVRGYGIAILLILLLLGVAMRSWQRTILAVPANVIPVALTLGIMGFAGIPLDVATATIATVILGLVVDDTVHMLRPGSGKGIRDSLATAAGRSGGTLLMTSIVLACGFLVLALADVRSVAWFGLLAGFAMIAAILTDLLLLPALASVRTAKNASTSQSSGFPYPKISTRSG